MEGDPQASGTVSQKLVQLEDICEANELMSP